MMDDDRQWTDITQPQTDREWLIQISRDIKYIKTKLEDDICQRLDTQELQIVELNKGREANASKIMWIIGGASVGSFLLILFWEIARVFGPLKGV